MTGIFSYKKNILQGDILRSIVIHVTINLGQRFVFEKRECFEHPVHAILTYVLLAIIVEKCLKTFTMGKNFRLKTRLIAVDTK